jgi:spore maturation protein CgeB
LDKGNVPSYLPPEGLALFDLVLSYTGGKAIDGLRERLGAKTVASLYGWVDPEVYSKVPLRPDYEARLSYLGTYAADRQVALERTFIEPARRLSAQKFIIAGAMYLERENWPKNIRYFEHINPPDHAAFYSSADLALNITRGTMAAMGYCPSGRLFEATACGTAVISDWWEGLDSFFAPNEEILITRSSDDSIRALRQERGVLTRIGARARERTMDCHTAAARAKRFMRLIEDPQEASKEDADVCERTR